MTKIAEASRLLVNSTATEHEIQADEQDDELVVKVWVKEPRVVLEIHVRRGD